MMDKCATYEHPRANSAAIPSNREVEQVQSDQEKVEQVQSDQESAIQDEPSNSQEKEVLDQSNREEKGIARVLLNVEAMADGANVVMEHQQAEKDSDDDSDLSSDDEGFDDAYDSDEEYDNELNENEVNKKLEQFRNEVECV